MFHKSKMREMTYGIIGLGKFGEALALTLERPEQISS